MPIKSDNKIYLRARQTAAASAKSSIVQTCQTQHPSDLCVGVERFDGKTVAVCGKINDFCQVANIDDKWGSRKKIIAASVGIAFGVDILAFFLFSIILPSSDSPLWLIAILFLPLAIAIGAAVWFYFWRRTKFCKSMDTSEIINSIPKAELLPSSALYKKAEKKGKICIPK